MAGTAPSSLSPLGLGRIGVGRRRRLGGRLGRGSRTRRTGREAIRRHGRRRFGLSREGGSDGAAGAQYARTQARDNTVGGIDTTDGFDRGCSTCNAEKAPGGGSWGWDRRRIIDKLVAWVGTQFDGWVERLGWTGPSSIGAGKAWNRATAGKSAGQAKHGSVSAREGVRQKRADNTTPLATVGTVAGGIAGPASARDPF